MTITATEGQHALPEIEVRVSPGEIPKVFWWGPSGKMWRIPHDWRRRRIKLPDRDGLLRNGLPPDIVEEFANQIVTVDYHQGSPCCLLPRGPFRYHSQSHFPHYHHPLPDGF